jgi:hypothetical protein
MPSIAPLTSSGSRELKRPRPIPKHVREMIRLMIYGRPDDPDGKPVDFIEAGRQCGIQPDNARKWLDRPDVIKLLRSERRAFREAICAGNEKALQKVRDTSENGMAVIGSVRTLEQLNEEDAEKMGRGRQQVPGLSIVIVNRPSPLPQPPQPMTIDVTPAPDPAFPE